MSMVKSEPGSPPPGPRRLGAPRLSKEERGDSRRTGWGSQMQSTRDDSSVAGASPAFPQHLTEADGAAVILQRAQEVT